MSTNTLGPLVRLWGVPTAQLPPASASADELAPLLMAILQEAVPFIDSAAPKDSPTGAADHTVWKHKGSHSHADSAAKVEVLERVVPAAELEKVASRSGGREGKDGKEEKVKGETWCCRRSVHEDKPEKGTASWDEFVRCFREEHAESEKAFTPACLDAYQALKWDCAGVEAEEGGLSWGGFKLLVEEMRHRIGKPVLKDRTFPVLQMTASAKGAEEFIVVSIPVPDFGTSETSRLAREKGAQVAYYVSVERMRKLDGAGDGAGGGKIEWLMATASDAAGALPTWVQNLAAPGVIWKDVPLFLGWIAKERRKRGKATETVTTSHNGGSKDKEEEAKGEEDGEAVPRASTGVEVSNVPTVSDGTNDAEAIASGNPQVSTGVEVSQTAKISESG
ncbi:hypothetical protein F5Y05DRAFT_365785 [Hypoxylon sp. FL0543]|nr:hypothetical protein F5Y05DRAFT_365785 [Hypoxylon sp. FL0543]